MIIEEYEFDMLLNKYIYDLKVISNLITNLKKNNKYDSKEMKNVFKL